MLELVTTGQFRKDYKRVKKRGYDMGLLEEVIDLLLNEQPLDERYRDHGLVGNYVGFRECHILPDWLLTFQETSQIGQNRGQNRPFFALFYPRFFAKNHYILWLTPSTFLPSHNSASLLLLPHVHHCPNSNSYPHQ